MSKNYDQNTLKKKINTNYEVKSDDDQIIKNNNDVVLSHKTQKNFFINIQRPNDKKSVGALNENQQNFFVKNDSNDDSFLNDEKIPEHLLNSKEARDKEARKKLLKKKLADLDIMIASGIF